MESNLVTNKPHKVQHRPSEPAGSDLHPVWIAREGFNESCTLACFSTRSIWPNKTSHSLPEQNQIWAGISQYDLGHLWKNATESENGKLVAGQLHSARTVPGDSCTLACFQTRSVWPKPDQVIQIRSGPVLHNVIQVFFGKMELNQMQEVRSAYMIWPNSGCTVSKILPHDEKKMVQRILHNLLLQTVTIALK